MYQQLPQLFPVWSAKESTDLDYFHQRRKSCWMLLVTVLGTGAGRWDEGPGGRQQGVVGTVASRKTCVLSKAQGRSWALTDSALRECRVYLLMLKKSKNWGFVKTQFLNPKVGILQTL